MHIISLPSSAIGTRVETRTNSSICKTQHHQLHFSSSKSTVSVTNSFSRIGHLGKQCRKHLFIQHITNILAHSLFIKCIETSLKSDLDSELRDPRGRMTSQFSMGRSRKVSSASTTSNVSVRSTYFPPLAFSDLPSYPSLSFEV